MTAPLLDARQVARLLGVSVKTVRRLVARGELDGYLVAGRLRIDPAEVERYLQTHRAGGDHGHRDRRPRPPRKPARQGRVTRILKQ